jgi:hypothetical protein
MKRTDFATKWTSSISLSRSARAVASARMGLYMLKKYSGTRNENACASIAENGKKEGGRGETKWLRAAKNTQATRRLM